MCWDVLGWVGARLGSLVLSSFGLVGSPCRIGMMGMGGVVWGSGLRALWKRALIDCTCVRGKGVGVAAGGGGGGGDYWVWMHTLTHTLSLSHTLTHSLSLTLSVGFFSRVRYSGRVGG